MGFPGGSAGKESACIVGGLGTNRVCFFFSPQKSMLTHIQNFLFHSLNESGLFLVVYLILSFLAKVLFCIGL